METLDLVFSNNCELLSSVTAESWDKFSDHNLVIASTTYQHGLSEALHDQQYLCDTGKRYSALNFHQDPWDAIREELVKVDWNSMEEVAKTCPSSALAEFHDKVLAVLEQLVPKRRKKNLQEGQKWKE